jgi:hypothetical protein
MTQRLVELEGYLLGAVCLFGLTGIGVRVYMQERLSDIVRQVDLNAEGRQP